MGRKRQREFLDAVAEAARNTPPPVRRGKPFPANLTQEGREKGLEAMQASPRCIAARRDGMPCKAAALRGATRCIKHGGRVEVPAHPHNVKRFFAGVLDREAAERDAIQTDQDYWDSLPSSTQREIASLVSLYTLRRPAKLYQAARMWVVVEGKGYTAQRRFLDQFART